jgi:flavodoxin
MKSLVVVYSYHHNNTEKIADVMAKTLGCKKIHLDEKGYEKIPSYDIVGFGAGIDSGKHYAPMLEFAKKLHPVQDKKAFIFSTSSILGEKKVKKDHTALREILLSKGYEIVGEFACKGFNTNSFLKLFGGINKGRPNAEDLHIAAGFASGRL